MTDNTTTPRVEDPASMKKVHLNPPAVEPQSYAAVAGFVKSQAENNDYYVAQFSEDEWFPAIKNAHRQLSLVVPGYNIAQIKSKFNGLRYYIDYPEGVSDSQVHRAEEIIRAAELWVNGWEDYKLYQKENNENIIAQLRSTSVELKTSATSKKIKPKVAMQSADLMILVAEILSGNGQRD